MTDPKTIYPSPNRRVLVIEDEPRLRTMLLRALPDMGFESIGAASGEDALKIMEDEPAAIAILDLNLPGINGLTVFERLREQWPDIQVVILTGYGDLDAAQQAIRLNVADFLTKPCTLGALEQALDRAWHRLLDEHGIPAPVVSPTSHMTTKTEPASADDPPRTIQNVEKELILAALDRNEGNRGATARELGISVRTLYYRLSQYEAREPD